MLQSIVFALQESQGKLFVSLNAGFGKSLLIAGMCHLRTQTLGESPRKVYVFSPNAFLSTTLKIDYTDWFDIHG